MAIAEVTSRAGLRRAWEIDNHSDIDGLFAIIRKASQEKSFNAPVKDFLEPHLRNRDGPVLDVGSNPLCNTYIPDDKEVVALDWTVDGLPFSGNRVIADVEQLPFPDEYFPVVLSKQVYGYALEPDNLVREMARVVKREGLFIMIDIEGKIARHDREVHAEIPRIRDFEPGCVEIQILELGLVDTNIERIRSWPDYEVAPGVKRDIALTCLSGLKP